ncbi:MAG TPA: glycosyltransferase family 4 protein [Solirubrobacteraceae bacterium]|nr:glycosyltransferase family 4 protein [Solirubrobacteraceae bacterium]
MSQLRDLYMTTSAPALSTGRDMRTYTCIRALATLRPVDLVYVPHDADEPSEAYLEIENLEFHKVEPSRGARRAALYASKRIRGIPARCCRGTSPELIATGHELAQRPDRGRVIVADANSATAMMSLARRRPIIYNAHNFEPDYVRSPILGNHALARATRRRYERKVISLASETWMVSQVDVESARKLVPTATVRYVPNVVDVRAILAETTKPTPDHPATGGSILMVGDFTYTPNCSGRELLVNSVLPLVWQSLPAARLTIAGRGMDDWRAPDPRIEVLGFVDSLAGLYEQADCVVVPITEGAGSSFKFIEALAYGVPVVATPKAARGLGVVAGVHYREGDDPATLAQAIVDVLREGGAEMVAEGRRLVEREYSIEALAERIAA